MKPFLDFLKPFPSGFKSFWRQLKSFLKNACGVAVDSLPPLSQAQAKPSGGPALAARPQNGFAHLFFIFIRHCREQDKEAALPFRRRSRSPAPETPMANAHNGLRRQGQDEPSEGFWISMASIVCARRSLRRQGGATRLAERLALRKRVREELEQALRSADPRLSAAAEVASQRFSSAIYAADCCLPLRLVAGTAIEVRRRTRFHGAGRRLPSMTGCTGSQHVLAMASIAAGDAEQARLILMERRCNRSLGR